MKLDYLKYINKVLNKLDVELINKILEYNDEYKKIHKKTL